MHSFSVTFSVIFETHFLSVNDPWFQTRRVDKVKKKKKFDTLNIEDIGLLFFGSLHDGKTKLVTHFNVSSFFSKLLIYGRGDVL